MRYKSIKDIFGFTEEELASQAQKTGEYWRKIKERAIMQIMLKNAAIYGDIPCSGEIKFKEADQAMEHIIDVLNNCNPILSKEIPITGGYEPTPCPDCKGTGKYIGAGINPAEPCSRCGGSGNGI